MDYVQGLIFPEKLSFSAAALSPKLHTVIVRYLHSESNSPALHAHKIFEENVGSSSDTVASVLQYSGSDIHFTSASVFKCCFPMTHSHSHHNLSQFYVAKPVVVPTSISGSWRSNGRLF